MLGESAGRWSEVAELEAAPRWKIMISVIRKIKLGVRPKLYLTQGIVQPLHRYSTG
jgi:hypothetical protein